MTKKLRVGVIGGGNIARRLHVPTWMNNPDVAVVAVADPVPTALAAIRDLAELGDADAHSDPLELIARTDVDIVDVCTPPSFRPALIVAAANAGKNVFAEKPLASTPAAAAEAVEAAERAGIVFAMGHNYLVLPEVRAVREVLDSGELGDIRTARVDYLGINYVAGAAGDWRHDPALSGGGVLMDIVHAVYLIEAFLGSPILRVSAYIDSADPTAHVEDLALCRFETANNAGLVNIAWGYGPGGIEITGSLGRVQVQYMDGGTAPWSLLERVTITTAAGTRVLLGKEPNRPKHYDEFPPISRSFPLLIADFVDAIRTGRRPLATGADGLRILEATVGAYASGATGKMIDIPLERTSPLFLRGTMGVAELERPAWSPLAKAPLFTPIVSE